MTSPIRTPDQKLRVFVSSTLNELAGERDACRAAIQGIRLTPVMFEMGARPHPPRDLYRAYLAQSDVFVGIYWQSYGWVSPEETISGLEDEYLLASQMPKLIYIKQAAARDDRLSELIGRIEADDKASYRPFSDVAELRELVENDLALMLTERFTAASAAQAAAAPQPGYEAPWLSLPPVERGELIGRAAEVESVVALLRGPDAGLITLTGPGGTGKSRLAIHLAHAVGPSFRDGTFFVALAAVRNPMDVVPAIVAALEVPIPAANADAETALTRFLRTRHALLILDNFEQVLGAAPAIGRLLVACPQLKVLTTSREALHIRGEHEVPIPPLPHHVRSEEDITPAMALFQQRVREVRPQFGIDADNHPAVAELCRRLDALPLAIELAAARARVLSPQAIVDRLQQSFGLLTGDKLDLPERHQTLHATIEWSLDLLSGEEREFFSRLGIFVGSFSEEAAAAVVGEIGLDPLEGITSLVEKSLLVRSEVRGEARFHMLETVRELAHSRVTEAGEARPARLRHARWLTEFHARAFGNLMDPATHERAREGLALEDAAARRALQFAAGPEGDVELAWQLFIEYGASQGLGNARTGEVLASYELLNSLPRSTDAVRAALALGIWSWARATTFNSAAAADFEAVCIFLEDAGERRILPAIQTAWGMLLISIDIPRAVVILHRALALAKDANQRAIEAWALQTICYGQLQAGAIDDAQRHADELAASSRSRNDEMSLAYSLTMRGRVQFARGDLAGARELYSEAVEMTRTGTLAWPRFLALCGLASVTLAEGDEVSARGIVEDALRFFRAVGYVGVDVLCGSQALFLAKAGEQDRALRVFAAVSPGAEDFVGYGADVTDPSGALREATRQARALLGNPPPVDPEFIDLEAALQAALGAGRGAD